MRKFIIAAVIAAAVIPGVANAGAVMGQDPMIGVWRNPKGSLAVRTQHCANGLCGAIVWANGEAQQDARDAGVPQLIGTQLLQNYRAAGRGTWAGRVYIPDMGRTFSSRIKQTSANELVISGCLIGGFICRSQVWHRIS